MKVYTFLLPSTLLLLVFTHSGDSLRCYSCIPVIQSGVDCAKVTDSQLRPCADDEDICRTTAVSLPGRDGIRELTINRDCGKRSLNKDSQRVGEQLCTPPTSEQQSQRISRMCQCSADACNTVSMAELNDNRVYGYYGPNAAFSVRTTIAPILSIVIFAGMTLILL